jgi:8-oxo-dGTP diphosphatase
MDTGYNTDKRENMSERKTIRVAAAIIADRYPDFTEIFATARGYGKWKGYWEFPGGKIEAEETGEEALQREIREELAVQIKIHEKLCTVEYDYPDFHLNMDCFLCTLEEGRIVLIEAQEGRWLTGKDLFDMKWLPADLEILQLLKNRMR